MTMKKHSHYFSPIQESNFQKRTIYAKLRGLSFEFRSGSGTFSKKKVDKGSTLLINQAIIKESWRVLDLGCGYGVIGVSIAKIFPKSEVVMIDINKRGVGLAKENAELNHVSNVSIFSSDLYSKVNGKFDTILLNPPQTAGKETCFKMINGSKIFLKKKGLLQIVARHNVGGKTLSQKMLEVFGNMQEIAKGSGYRVYVSENN